jgi:hypothetical protein
MGGGYLYGDEASGQYVGVVQLAFAGVQLSAIGLLSTRLPGGQRGFSLLVLISFTFPPVQLGFGFALTGVGGLIGVHRTVSTCRRCAAGWPKGRSTACCSRRIWSATPPAWSRICPASSP